MNRTPFFVAAGAVAAFASSVSRDARAVGPVDVEVGVIAGGGTVPTHQGNAAVVSGYVSPPALPNPLGFGLGGRAGVGFHGLYAGVEGMYDFGGTLAPPYGVKASSHLVGVDVGYSFKLPIITIRPLVGIGDFTEQVSDLPQPSCPAGSGPCSNPDQSFNTLYLQPGVTVLVSLGTLYVGADANLLVLTSLPEYAGCNCSNGNDQLELALTFHAQAGLRF